MKEQQLQRWGVRVSPIAEMKGDGRREGTAAIVGGLGFLQGPRRRKTEKVIKELQLQPKEVKGSPRAEDKGDRARFVTRQLQRSRGSPMAEMKRDRKEGGREGGGGCCSVEGLRFLQWLR